ncbi:MAG: Tetracycline resistance protein, class C [Acidimicrobiales bacterium AG-410-I20]|nr:MAG: Tetracycline resistance protein, class C [Acidimicrobiales bacterium AG-410-I20]
MAASSRGNFDSLKVRNYRLYWFGAVLKNNGRWAQYVATYYIIFKLTESASWVGITAFANFVPMLVVNPLTGWISDNLNRRNVLVATNLVASFMAGLMAIAWGAGLKEPGVWVAIFFLNGTISGLLIPVSQAFVAECVPQNLLRNAITLNSTQFNAARALGPAIGGLILGFSGPGWTLAAVVLFYGPMLVCLLLMESDALMSPQEESFKADRERPSVISDYKESVRYVRGSRGISAAILTIAIISTFGFPVVQQIIVFAEEVFEVSPFLFGLLGSAQGIGAVLAVPLVTGYVNFMKPSVQQLIATVGYGFAVMIFALAPSYTVAFFSLGILGIMHLISASNLNSVVQLQVDEEMRGRVMAIYLVGVLGPAPFAGLAMGLLVSAFGPRLVVALSGSILAFLAVVLWFRGKFSDLNSTT